MSALRRPGRGGGHGKGGHHGPDERWMASYMDMVTVLMCLFIVLYSMSTVDQAKYEQLRSSLADGFNAEIISTTGAGKGSGEAIPALQPQPPGEDAPTGRERTEEERARDEVTRLEQIRDRIDAALADRGVGGAVDYSIDESGLTVRLIGAETFFPGNSTAMSRTTETVLSAIGSVVSTLRDPILVEGHADPRGSSAPFPTDWELASGRATAVVRHLVERTGIAGPRASAIGYGSQRPLTTGASVAEIALNRRVDVVIVSSEPDAVRALIPSVLGERPEAPSSGAG